MKKGILSLVLALTLLVTFIPTAFATRDQASNWAREYVREANDLGLVPSHLNARFTDAITRAEFTHLAVALYEATTGRTITGRTTFTDTDDVNVQMMAYLGVVQGVGGGRFNPDGLLTRQEAAAMLSRLIGVIETPMRNHPATFADGDSISSWAVDYVGQMRLFGIMGGVGGNRFDPNGRYTIEQSITTMLRVFQMESVSDINDFLCGINLEWLRYGAPAFGPFPGLGVDFSIGEVIGSSPQGRPTDRILNFTDPHWLYLPSFGVQIGANDLETQTGDVIINLNSGYTNRYGVIAYRFFWHVRIDVGNLFEVWEAGGNCFDTLFRQNPNAHENSRALASFGTDIGECNC